MWKRATLVMLTAVLMTAGCGRATGDGEAGRAAAGNDEHAVSVRGTAGSGDAQIRWVESWQQAFEQAKESDRPVVASFYADWCVWCKRLETKTFNDHRVAELMGSQAVALRLDVDGDGRQLARDHGVQGLPTVVVFAPDGDEIGRVDGYVPAKDFLSAVAPMLGGGQKS